MRSTLLRRASIVVVSAGILAVFAKTALAAGAISSAQVVLAVAGCVFGYIVLRLSQTMFAADPAHRRRARTGLIVAAAVPVLMLTPTAIGSSPPELTSALLIASAVWLALAMAYTSFILAKAGRVGSTHLVLHKRDPERIRGTIRRPRREHDGVLIKPRPHYHVPLG